MTAVLTGSGTRLVLGSVLGKGGEGIVHHVQGNADLAVKLYTDGKAAERGDKIGTMVAAGYHRLSDFVAFPVDVVVGQKGEFIGFTMRKVAGVKPIHELYAPGSRKSEFPKADFRFLVRTALNFAKASASIHQVGCVIGDINHSGILVSERATVTLIDSDSFQIKSGSKVYRCRVGVGEYTPPELQGQSLEAVDRTLTHDAFGVAVILFQLLFMGKHPYHGRYSGRGDMPTEKAITEGRFAYSLGRRAQTLMEPPPFAVSMTDLVPDIAYAFERAFHPTAFHQRPSSAEWVAFLGKMEAELIDCRINPAHQHPRNAPSCPWCRIEGGAGVVLFRRTVDVPAPRGAVTFDLAAALAAIDRVISPGMAPDPVTILPSTSALQPSTDAKWVRSRFRNRKIAGWIVGALSILLMLSGASIAFIGLIAGGALILGGDKLVARLEANRLQAENEWKRVRDQWHTEAGHDRFNARKAELRRLAEEHGQLIGLERMRLDDLDRRKRDVQLRTHLEAHLISRAKIKGIGDSRKSTLASFGIEDAADVTRDNVRQVPGFGDGLTSSLLAWRETVERKFVFNPARATDPAAIALVKADIARKRSEIEQALARGPIDLQQIAAHAISLRTSPGRPLIEAYTAFRQAQLNAGSE